MQTVGRGDMRSLSLWARIFGFLRPVKITRIDVYVLKRFLSAFLGALLVLTTIALVAVFLAEIKTLMQNPPEEGIKFGDVMWLYFGQTPFWLVLISPLAMGFAVIYSLSSMFRDNEAVAIVGAGVARFRFTMAVVIFAFVYSAFMMFFTENIVVPTYNKSQEVKEWISGGGQVKKLDTLNLMVLKSANGVSYMIDLYNPNTLTFSRLAAYKRRSVEMSSEYEELWTNDVERRYQQAGEDYEAAYYAQLEAQGKTESDLERETRQTEEETLQQREQAALEAEAEGEEGEEGTLSGDGEQEAEDAAVAQQIQESYREFRQFGRMEPEAEADSSQGEAEATDSASPSDDAESDSPNETTEPEAEEQPESASQRLPRRNVDTVGRAVSVRTPVATAESPGDAESAEAIDDAAQTERDARRRTDAEYLEQLNVPPGYFSDPTFGGVYDPDTPMEEQIDVAPAETEERENPSPEPEQTVVDDADSTVTDDKPAASSSTPQSNVKPNWKHPVQFVVPEPKQSEPASPEPPTAEAELEASPEDEPPPPEPEDPRDQVNQELLSRGLTGLDTSDIEEAEDEPAVAEADAAAERDETMLNRSRQLDDYGSESQAPASRTSSGSTSSRPMAGVERRDVISRVRADQEVDQEVTRRMGNSPDLQAEVGREEMQVVVPFDAEVEPQAVDRDRLQEPLTAESEEGTRFFPELEAQPDREGQESASSAIGARVGTDIEASLLQIDTDKLEREQNLDLEWYMSARRVHWDPRVEQWVGEDVMRRYYTESGEIETRYDEQSPLPEIEDRPFFFIRSEYKPMQVLRSSIEESKIMAIKFLMAGQSPDYKGLMAENYGYKYAFPLSALVIALIGVNLGRFHSRRASMVASFLWALLLFLVYFILHQAAVSFAKVSDVLPPEIMVHSGNIAFVIMAIIAIIMARS